MGESKSSLDRTIELIQEKRVWAALFAAEVVVLRKTHSPLSFAAREAATEADRVLAEMKEEGLLYA